MFFFGGQGANLTISNSIVAGNTAGSFGPDLVPDFAGTRTIKFSLIGDENGSGLTASTSPDANGNLIGPHASPIDAKLGPLADNGGRTKTHALLPGSPALDGGDPNFDAATFTAAGFAGPFVFDERGDGYSRLVDGGGPSRPIVDIGAYESQGAPTGYPTGDFNQNGIVDGADYVVWRKSGGNAAAYQLWRSNFGNTTVPTQQPVTIPLILPLAGPLGDDSIANGAEALNQNGPLGIDGVHSLLVTSTFSVQNGGNGLNALPTSGFYPFDFQHFDIQLAYRDANNTNSVLHLDAGEAGEINIPDGSYAQLDLIATSGDGQSPLTVTLHYSNGTQTAMASTAPDWFDDPAGLTSSNSITQGDAQLYFLQSGMDRVNGLSNTYEPAADAAIFGLRFAVDPNRILQSITVANVSGSGSVLTVLGGALSHLTVAGGAAAAPLTSAATNAAFALYGEPAATIGQSSSNLVARPMAPAVSQNNLMLLLFDHNPAARRSAADNSRAMVRNHTTSQSEVDLNDFWDNVGEHRPFLNTGLDNT